MYVYVKTCRELIQTLFLYLNPVGAEVKELEAGQGGKGSRRHRLQEVVVQRELQQHVQAQQGEDG